MHMENGSENHLSRKNAIIIGAGPAGLTAAFELLTRTDILPIVLEKSTYFGGISRTVNYKGNRIDIGGHRFFSKSDRVTNWWLQHLPIEENGPAFHADTGRAPSAGEPADHRVMLVRQRKSRIYFLRKFFDYPIRLNLATLRKLGVIRVAKIGLSYLGTVLFPPKHVDNLEQFFVSRFGWELYNTFFKSYTEKVWGVPCTEISAEWGAQRVKGLSIASTLWHAVKRKIGLSRDRRQKKTETSLIEQFIYPCLGPGQLWEIVAEKVEAMGGHIVRNFDVTRMEARENKIVSVGGYGENDAPQTFEGDYFFSTMPVKELTTALTPAAPVNVRAVSDGLKYRDFITVGLLLNKLAITEKKRPAGRLSDNWIYIQEPDVLAARLQIFNNWSPYLVEDPQKIWVGVEYLCSEADDLWKKPDAAIAALAIQELSKIGIIDVADVRDSTVIRMPKAYPAYFGTFHEFAIVREYLSRFENLFLVGRNGMHKYNNQDHSMLTAMTAVDNIVAGRTNQENIWAVNTETEYHEEK